MVYPFFITFAPIFLLINQYNTLIISYVWLMLIFGFFGNVLLKNISKFLFPNCKLFKRPNPPSFGCGAFRNCNNPVVTWGMPSGHTQIAVMTSVFWILYILDNNPNLDIWNIFTIFKFIILAIIISISRVYLGCHNWIQVFTGAFIGIILGIFIYKLAKYLDKKYNSKINKKY